MAIVKWGKHEVHIFHYPHLKLCFSYMAVIAVNDFTDLYGLTSEFAYGFTEKEAKENLIKRLG